uniref:AIG1-type G domain-containing protein n=1 Tax=Panagrolaimus davidi TaxID=227884 RepID=A0A914P8P6_9BILA
MENQTTKVSVEPMEFGNKKPTAKKEEENLQNDPADLIQEAALFANSLNERLKSLNEADAELFMKNFEKNVLLLPKNTKPASNPSNQLSTQTSNDSVHDFVLLDSDDTAATANDQDNATINQGMAVFGTSMKPPQITKNELGWHFLTKNENNKPQNSKTEKEDASVRKTSAERKNDPTTDRYNDAVIEGINSERSTTLSNDSTPLQLVKNHQTNISDQMEKFGYISNRKPQSSSSNRHENLETTTDKNVAENSKKEKLDYRQNIANSTKPDTLVSLPLELRAVQTQVSNVTQQRNDWLQESSKLGKSNKKSINILVLGQTGVGKSTWINAFANYLTYGTLEEAIAAEAPVCVIPTKFSLFDENYQRHDILLGNHSNEVFSDKGQSATQNAKTYLFEKDEYDIYIIDTPGMDDTRGSKQDDENVQKILRAVSPFKELHAICFLFKANESRLTQSFKYCISKLLGNLSKSALNNACFVFTNARGTFYKPGDTMGPLKTYFKELQMKENLSVTINDSNTFCLDNEAFRFICAYFSKIQFGQPEIKTYADSWKHSSNQIIRLLNHAARLRPHSTSETLSINETRTWILQLVKPVIDVSAIIQTNVQQLDERIRELHSLENNIEYLQKRSAIPITALETRKMDKPQTVCASLKCVSYEMIDGNLQEIYKTVCHKPCYLEFSESSQFFDPNLENCIIFYKDKCNKCGCQVADHKRMIYEQRIVMKHLETQKLRNTLASEVDASKIKKRLIRDCEKMVNGYKNELDFVLYAMANFSIFLTQNGISHKSDIFEKYLENLIEGEEKMLHQIPNSCNKKHIRMVSLLMLYQDTRQKLLNEKASTPISLTEIQDIRQKLFSMPLTGSKIAEIFDIHVEVENNEHAGNVTRCDTKSAISQCVNWTKNKMSSFFGRHGK